MGKPVDPFSGIALSGQPPLKQSALDQRLFAPASPPRPVQTVQQDQPESPTRQAASKRPATAGNQPVGEEPKPLRRPAPKTETNVRTMIRTNERSNVRTNVRHSFDCWQDQLLALRQIAMEREVVLGDRVTLGDLVKEALDTFIANERSTERTDDRPAERTIERS